MKVIGILFMLILLIQNSKANNWSQTKEEKDLFLTPQDRFLTKLEESFDKCRPTELGLYVIARQAETLNFNVLPCDYIQRIQLNLGGTKLIYDDPDRSTLNSISEKIQKLGKVVGDFVIVRSGKSISEKLVFTDGKLGLAITDLATILAQKDLAKYSSEKDRFDHCRSNNWQSCFASIPWSSSHLLAIYTLLEVNKDFKAIPVTDILTPNMFGTDFREFKYRMGGEYDKDLYAQLHIKKNDSIEDTQLSLAFIVIGNNRLALAAASERTFIPGSLDREGFINAFKSKHSKSKSVKCESMSCEAEYKYQKIVSKIKENQGKVGQPVKAGVFLYNSVYMRASLIDQSYNRFVKSLNTADERQKLLDSLKSGKQFGGSL